MLRFFCNDVQELHLKVIDGKTGQVNHVLGRDPVSCPGRVACTVCAAREAQSLEEKDLDAVLASAGFIPAYEESA